MRELLEKWAELEPLRCKPHNGFNCKLLMGSTWLPVHYDADLVTEQPVILWSTIAAIVARSWEFDLENYGTNSDKFIANVFAIKPPIRSQYLAEDRANPAEALLSAYIQALEANRLVEA